MAQRMTIAEVPSFTVVRERVYPFLCGVVCAGLMTYASPAVFVVAAKQHWHVGDLYLAGFEFASVATSFLFTFYTFVLTAERGFIAKMKHSIYYQSLITYTVRAMVLGVLLAIISLPLMITDPTPDARWSWATLAVALWALVAGWTLGAFIRTARLFIAFTTADQ